MAISDDQQPTSSIIKEEKPFSELKALSNEEMQVKILFFNTINFKFKERVQYVRDNIINNCLGLISNNRTVVNGLADLIAVFADDPAARTWVTLDFIERLKKQLCAQMDNMQNEMENPEAIQNMAAAMQLFNLIWQNFPNQNIYKKISDKTSTDDDFTLGLEWKALWL